MSQPMLVKKRRALMINISHIYTKSNHRIQHGLMLR